MIPPITPTLFAAFSRYTRWYAARGFHAVRVSKTGLPPGAPPGTPLVIFLNHASWWDPLMALLLANRYWPQRRHYAPIDQAALGKYGIMRRLGFFGVEANSRRGSAAFLRTSVEILKSREVILWITAQGGFRDPRVRPVELRPGLAALARRAPTAALIPLAIEYPFWTERYSEALCRFGPITHERDPAALELALGTTQQLLAEDAISQDARRFETILKGAGGVGFFYDAWRRMKAAAKGKKFSAEHGEEP